MTNSSNSEFDGLFDRICTHVVVYPKGTISTEEALIVLNENQGEKTPCPTLGNYIVDATWRTPYVAFWGDDPKFEELKDLYRQHGIGWRIEGYTDDEKQPMFISHWSPGDDFEVFIVSNKSPLCFGADTQEQIAAKGPDFVRTMNDYLKSGAWYDSYIEFSDELSAHWGPTYIPPGPSVLDHVQNAGQAARPR